jgi:hypothetical protein
MSRVHFVLALVLALSIAGMAQRQKPADDVSDTSNSQPKSGKQNKTNNKGGRNGGGELNLSSATSLAAQLQGTLDAKNAHVGDEVVLKTVQSIRQNGEVVIPKGTSLVGRVTEVQQRTKQNAVSRLGLVFDRLEGKNLATPITASIISIVDTRSAASLGDTMASDISGTSSTSASGSAGGPAGGGLLGGSGGGGLLGGVGGTVGAVTNTTGGLVNTAASTVGGVANTTTSVIGGTTQSLGGALKGISLTQSASGSASGSTTLSSGSRNVRVEKGVTFNMQLSEAATANAN